MPRLRKFIFNKTVIFVTTSLEEGLLLAPNRLINIILLSALARAQKLHPVTIVRFMVEPSHIHFIFVVDNPDDIRDFMERFKTESAHAINRLLGRKKRTIWCRGYDSPILLTPDDVVRKIVYVETNPVKDNLVDTVRDYPGLSNRSIVDTRSCPHILRWMVPTLERLNLDPAEYGALARTVIRQTRASNNLRIEPDAWMRCFDITGSENVSFWNRCISEGIQEAEDAFRRERIKAKKKVMGISRLINRPLDPSYMPKKRDGRKMWVICSDIAFRKVVIGFLKILAEEAREVYRLWKLGNCSLRLPPGVYAPAMPKQAEMLLGQALAW